MNKFKTYTGVRNQWNDGENQDSHPLGLNRNKELLYLKHFKTYPTHRLYTVVFSKQGKKFSHSEKLFFRELTYTLLTPNHDFDKSFSKQVFELYRQSKTGVDYTEDGKLQYTYSLYLTKPVTVKLEEFEHNLRMKKSTYRSFGVSGKSMNVRFRCTKLRTKDDSKYLKQFESTTEQLKMVA